MAFDNESFEEENFAEMFAASEKQQETSRIVEGEIVEIQADENRALVGVGDKLEGILSLDEISENGKLKFNVGDKIKVMVTGYYNERPKISYKKVLEQQKTIDFIDQNKENFEDIIIDGVITKKNRGGYVVEADDVSFFMPRSLAAFKDTDEVIGRKIKAQVVKIDPEQNSIVVSRRKLFNDERKKKKEIIDKLMENDALVEGTIKKITSYGMFVDVGGVDGLVHYNEISYKGPVNPSKLYKEGDSVMVKAISYDKDKRHLSLSIKAVQSDPWAEVESELDEGDTITVTVSNVEAYGVFVDLGNDIEGFLHISEISWDKNVKNPNDYLTVGQEIDVEVIEINPKTHKLRVSLKRLLPKPFDEFMKNHREGDIISGTVTSLTDFGAFVRIDGVEGLLHNQDISWDKNVKCKDVLKTGDKVEVKIAKISPEDQKISLNRKALLESPIDAFAKTHKLNSIVTGTIRDIKDFGVFVSLGDGVDALIRDEDLAPLEKSDLAVGQTIEAAIAVVDTRRDRIRLSVKKLDYIKNQAMLEEINDNQSHSLGDLIKDKFK
ncbi:MAG: 30S ribosomal protein S1 [Sulfurimonas sp.]|jgi:small subunit ribosomal protein S1|uniref:30S ribosomal protein S1 n=1 Tax=unclassified Sulfurimonas TaxID=2623549 RepID=UPI0008C2EA90|nr:MULTISPECIES: 30S ribosomal protein S1 [unclassified Sulfurimonas]OHE08658.1 MAG: 30S ribosomal protein S1 [Sulfurimonas sp. RIFOXYC2_FULL_36_7]OHE21123.1 MAG: 30S ribosomal protein S1 [Sulfurimonas sp. RIFOXYD2_FULL_37_8]MBS4068477.1 30S ribosomal protein S1 [Sulfurimonas sp.]MDD3854913.1 30S ribosomal protein S1 [Sulfurimonas sp.]OHE03935.1 MAG: 30S ribosomal protein S1 [Sulfurimonas sp. RIFOXYB12_FULL_35_9]